MGILIHKIWILQTIWHFEYHMLNWNTLSVKPTLALNTINVLPYNIYNINFLEFLLLQYQTILWGEMNTYYMQITLLFSSITYQTHLITHMYFYFSEILPIGLFNLYWKIRLSILFELHDRFMYNVFQKQVKIVKIYLNMIKTNKKSRFFK